MIERRGWGPASEEAALKEQRLQRWCCAKEAEGGEPDPAVGRDRGDGAEDGGGHEQELGAAPAPARKKHESGQRHPGSSGVAALFPVQIEGRRWAIL